MSRVLGRGAVGRFLIIAALASLAVFLVPGFVISSRADATILSSSVENGYPKQLTFKVTAQGTETITDLTLNYSITGRGTSALGKVADLTPAKTLSAEYNVQVNSGNSYIPVGSEFTYHWDIATADGKTTAGPEAKFFYLPTGNDWKSVSGDIMTVYFHSGHDALAQAYLKAGLDTFDKMGKNLFGTTLKQIPVKVILFDDEKEMNGAKAGGGTGKFDASVTTCGQKVSNDIVMVIPRSCGTGDQTDTLRHEFTHIIDDAAGISALGKLPSWLDEGTAVYGQSTPGSGFTGAFDAAAKSNRLIPFAQMASLVSDARLVDLFYGQSYTMVKYLIDKSGPAQFAKLYATIKQGNRFDEALKQVYGFDTSGFEKEFLAAAGSRPQSVPTAAPTRASQQQSTPTKVPTAANSSSKPTATGNGAGGTNSSSSSDAVDNTALVLGGVALLFTLLALFAFLISMMMANNRRSQGGGPPEPPAPPPFAPS